MTERVTQSQHIANHNTNNKQDEDLTVHTTSMDTQSGSRVLNTKPRFLAADTRARSSEMTITNADQIKSNQI